MKLAFLGIGQMGLGMAGRLAQAGLDLCVYNRNIEKCAPLEALGAKVAKTPGEAVADAGIVFTMLADDEALLSVVSNDTLKKMPEDAIHVSMSTISTTLAAKMAENHRRRHRKYLACPVFGRPDAAAAGQLRLCISGDADVKAQVLPYLTPMGEVWDFGDSDTGANIVKLAGNFMIGSLVELLGEAFSLVEKNGVSPQEFARFITSTMFAAPAIQTYSKLILDADFDNPGFTARLAAKDMGLVREAARTSSTPMPIAAIVEDRYLRALGRGWGDKDISVISHGQREDAGLV